MYVYLSYLRNLIPDWLKLFPNFPLKQKYISLDFCIYNGLHDGAL